MAFGALQRKSSNPPPFRPKSSLSRPNALFRKRLKTGGLIALAVLTMWMLYHRIGSSPKPKPAQVNAVPQKVAPEGSPEVVIVTVMDKSLKESYVKQMQENRNDYARRQGYSVLYIDAEDFDLGKAPKSWALIPALRQAMTMYPYTTYFFSLSPHALFMNPTLSLVDHVMRKERLEALMLKDKPVVPPDSVIHTFSHLRGTDIDLVITQDKEGLNPESFIIRGGDWAKYFLDVWYDPLYRSYNFQKAEGHALEHIVQWHPTILTRLALIPQRLINSYTVDIASRGGKAVTFQEGDWVVRAVGCEKGGNRDCAREMEPWYKKWRSMYGPKS